MADLVGVLRIIDKLKEDGVIEDFIIGGGIACTFHSEAVTTDDLDIFVLTPQPAPLILTYTPVYEALEKYGAKWNGEYLVLNGVKLQFVFIEKDLAKESFDNPDYIDVGDLKIKIEAPEYLIAKYTDIQRGKDLIKIHNLLRDAKVDFKKLKDILVRYGLLSKYNILVKKFGLSGLKEQKFVSKHSSKELFDKKEKYHRTQANIPVKDKIEQINGILVLGEQIKKVREQIKEQGKMAKEKKVKCKNCGGKGYIGPKKPYPPNYCPVCGGVGQVVMEEGQETKSKKQVRYLLSKGSPLTKKQKDKLKKELESGEVTIKEAYEKNPMLSGDVDYIVRSINKLDLDVNEPYNLDEGISAVDLAVDILEDALDSVFEEFFDYYELLADDYNKKTIDGKVFYIIPFSVISLRDRKKVFGGFLKAETTDFEGTKSGAVKNVKIFNVKQVE